MKLDKISIPDYKFVPSDPDPDFDVERNMSVIDEVIENTERMRNKKRKEFEDKLRERTGAVAMYLKNVQSGDGESNVEKYFGKKHLAYLRGVEVLERLKEQLSVTGKKS